ncbi:24659_t:CDS:2 [Racocetra persica]|uniref:24659_t:CDS:1 n=1 Tax=Racocetra persica TaxID=160502 RepID=A0ACA9MIZ1_9GLOM|nr:24659_t:CDS:2 [Racocetra persica]
MSSTKYKESKTTLTNKQIKAIITHKEKNPQLSQANLTNKKHEVDASVDDDIVNAAIPQLKEILKGYDLKDIYNIDETGLFYQY